MQLFLETGKSNIVKIQRQVYIYPQKTDDGMMRDIVFQLGKNSPWPPLSELPGDTSLQRQAIGYMEKGGKFHAQGMFLLNEELPRFGEDTYFNQKYYEDFVRRYGVEA
jgi:hypothetical protein